MRLCFRLSRTPASRSTSQGHVQQNQAALEFRPRCAHGPLTWQSPSVGREKLGSEAPGEKGGRPLCKEMPSENRHQSPHNPGADWQVEASGCCGRAQMSSTTCGRWSHLDNLENTQKPRRRPRGPQGEGGLSYAFGLSAFLRHLHQASTKNHPEVQKFQLFPHCRK